MHDQAIPRQQTGYQLEQFENEILLYDSGKTQVVYLNETAALVWQLCDGQRTVAQLRALILDAYPEQSDQIHPDIDVALQQLQASGAIENT